MAQQGRNAAICQSSTGGARAASIVASYHAIAYRIIPRHVMSRRIAPRPYGVGVGRVVCLVCHGASSERDRRQLQKQARSVLVGLAGRHRPNRPTQSSQRFPFGFFFRLQGWRALSRVKRTKRNTRVELVLGHVLVRPPFRVVVGSLSFVGPRLDTASSIHVPPSFGTAPRTSVEMQERGTRAGPRMHVDARVTGRLRGHLFTCRQAALARGARIWAENVDMLVGTLW